LYEEQPYYGLLLITARHTEFWLANDLHVKKIKQIELAVTNSHQKGGSSQGRFDRIFQNKRDRNDGYLIEQIVAMYYDKQLNKPKVLGLIIGGNAETRNRVIKELDMFNEYIVANIPYEGMDGLGLYQAVEPMRTNYENRATNSIIQEIETILRLEPDRLDFGREIVDGLSCYKYGKVYYNRMINVKEHPECEFIFVESDWLDQYGNYIGVKF
jgi:peptide subunit release factor 1 (eRF1)